MDKKTQLAAKFYAKSGNKQQYNKLVNKEFAKYLKK